MTNQFFRGRLVTATHPTSEPFSLARKQPSGSNASEEMRFLVPGWSRNWPSDSSRILRRTLCSSDPRYLRIMSDNDCCLLSALRLESGCSDWVFQQACDSHSPYSSRHGTNEPR